MATVSKAQFDETIQDIRFLIKGEADKHDTLAGKFDKFITESTDFMKNEIEKHKAELSEQIADTMREAGTEAATHKTEIDEKVEKQADEIKGKVKRQDEENERRKAAIDSMEGELKELLTEKNRCRHPVSD